MKSEAAKDTVRKQETANRTVRKQEAVKDTARKWETANHTVRKQEAAKDTARKWETANHTVRKQEAADSTARKQEAAMALLGNLVSEQYHGTVPGIVRGTVKENWDDKHQGMLKVEIFLGEQGKSVTGWVPVMTNYAGNEYGFYFLPEVGQAVLVAFESGEKSCPVVIGALWDKKNVLPKETANENNTVKRFLTKGGCEIVFDDEEGKENIKVTTPAKLSVSLQDEKKLITLQDENGDNAIAMDCENGNISVQAKTKITLMIGTDEVVTIDANSVSIKSKDIKNEAQNGFSAEAQNVKLAAKANVNLEGNANVEVKASGSMKLNSSGVLEIKGSMVKIN